MNRRNFLLNSATLACAVKLAPFALAQGDTPQAWDAAYRKMTVIDACCAINTDDIPLKTAVLQECLASGVTVVNWTVSEDDFEATVGDIATVQSLADTDPAHFTIIRHYSDIQRAKQDGKIGVVMGFQFPGPIETDLKRLEMFRNLGVLIMQVTYNNRGLFGDGCLEPGNAGLSKLGRTAIAKMNEMGIAVDLSHCGQRTTAEGITASTKPPLITHAGCNAIHQHPRNKEDRELKLLADQGGVIGIYFMPYLVASPTSPTHEHALQHLDHALKIAGTDHVGIGSDGILNTWPETPEQAKKWQEHIASRAKQGIAAPEEDRPAYCPDLNTTKRMEIISAGLTKRGYSADVVEKVMGENFDRAFREIWGST